MDLLTNLRQQKLRKCFLEKRRLFAARTAYRCPRRDEDGLCLLMCFLCCLYLILSIETFCSFIVIMTLSSERVSHRLSVATVVRKTEQD